MDNGVATAQPSRRPPSGYGRWRSAPRLPRRPAAVGAACREPQPVGPAHRAGARAVPSRRDLLGGVAAAMALVKAYRMHGHLAARLDPLGSEPMGDPALDESRLVPA